jgi:hypothetical protein
VQRNFPGLYTYAILFLLISAFSCTKIDSTSLGSELIPAVDNVSTFADTLDIIGTQGTFNDSSRAFINDLHLLGGITNDPVFGTTKAEVFLELKPSFYPYFFGSAGDTIRNPAADSTGYDSVVLCLSTKSFYGDTTRPHKLKVYRIKNSNTDFTDSLYLLNYRPDQGNYGEELGSATVDPTHLRDTIHYPGSAHTTVTNQIRIKLSDNFLASLVANTDTSADANGIYRNDANFTSFLKGFAIVEDASTQGNGLFYVNITDPATRLEIHYRKRSSTKVVDTSFSSFYLFPRIDTAIGRSPHANYLQRDSSGSELVSRQPDALYILSTPGTYAKLSIPGLDTFKNSIIHRAEIELEQVPSSNPAIAEVDKVLIPPYYMYLDLYDTISSNNAFKPVYHDLNTSSYYNPDNSSLFFPSQGINYNYFGGYLRSKDNGAGTSIYYYTFNVSRYVQDIVTNHIGNYKLRLYAPSELYYYGNKIAFSNNRASGRIKIGNGNNPGYKLRMRIVYSRI